MIERSPPAISWTSRMRSPRRWHFRSPTLHGEINLRETGAVREGGSSSMESYSYVLKFLNYERLGTNFEAHSAARQCLEGAIKKNDPIRRTPGGRSRACMSTR